MERRVLLAIALSFLVLFLYQTFLLPPPRPTQTASDLAPGEVGAPQPTAPGLPGLPGGNLTAPEPVPPPAIEAVVGDTEEREIVIDTDRVRAVFTNRGGRLRQWVLREYLDDTGSPLTLVPALVPAGLPLPFSLRVEDAETTARLNDALYRITVRTGADEPESAALPDRGTSVDGSTTPVTLIFEAETADGLRVRKQFAFEPASYIVSFSASVAHEGETLNPAVDWGPGLGDEIARTAPGSFFTPMFLYKAQGIYQTDGDVERLPEGSLGAGVAHQGQFKWAGVDDHYFISAVVDPPAPLHIEYVPVRIPTMTVPAEVGHYVAYAVRFPSPPEHARFYVGPKQLDELRAVDPEFTRAIYFGIVSPLAAPLLLALKWVHEFVGSWGLSIVVLTILINLVMFPLRHKSVVSMRKMQELQPQMKAIQERYAKYKITDPERQKMNQEVMELYRSKGVNPASGCVPMLLTLPFLFAFYAMLGQAIEIRGEGFLGYIRDLSRADPLYITPALMGLSMFWQQKITPTTADPTQRRIMMFMPIMITVMMAFAPAGLVIYWLMSNVFAIGQQYLTNYLIGPPKVHTVRPPAERRVRKSEKTSEARSR